MYISDTNKDQTDFPLWRDWKCSRFNIPCSWNLSFTIIMLLYWTTKISHHFSNTFNMALTLNFFILKMQIKPDALFLQCSIVKKIVVLCSSCYFWGTLVCAFYSAQESSITTYFMHIVWMLSETGTYNKIIKLASSWDYGTFHPP